ncbi:MULTISPECIES: sulfate reduction electron transfer complex DsrMKJOP subunit DsrJ [Nitratidesulfovibrio]|mgnify:FL=1|uniref:Cytochrome c family protein n=2 Tax=Nitratidesulfovibrio TaxID=2802295 RepID=B8DN85_NITV9|nr:MULTISPECIES: sulfate reduction electron transfer complex DsrMKJOP subunit DsrJ [Nitratidesulfovibrio]MBG3877126.1 cytochrome C [Nitratidesulfovibrio oxamicus]MBZ2171457.1 sulfate reduction electron transfer complex DsrMKJOP subunit DsrJ [Nitratidesulfovibrio sp. SRB-5]RXF78369.1 cytochrome C [Desulfovibrio sp. DS-1]
MYNGKYIIPGIVIFVGLFTFPFWSNLLTPKYERPQLAMPADQKECIEPAEYMRAEHMHILDVWRDQALREGKRAYVASNGKVWDISLQNTCMKCHANKADFCDKCHNSNSVSPYCWDCHVAPRGNQ